VSLSLENLDFKFVTLTRAATQPVALFMAFGPWARYMPQYVGYILAKIVRDVVG
jgi:hypothetical protein